MRKRGPAYELAATAVMMMMILVLPAYGLAQGNDKNDERGKERGPAPNPIGAWFGIARPCTPPAVGVPVGAEDPAPDETMCKLACDGEDCAQNVFPLLQVTMIPTLLADGTVLADDFGELLDHHTTAHGKWEFAGKVNVDGRKLDKYQATFIWFSGALPGEPANPAFIGSIRPRFVTFFDKHEPDQMRGYIQPYIYRYTSTSPDGIGAVNYDGTGKFPDPSPTDPLPETCNPQADTNPKCLGTLHFYISRIPAH